MDKNACIANLLDVIEQAIKSGDWKVDGSCDPDWQIRQAAYVLQECGWSRNGIDGLWQNSA